MYAIHYIRHGSSTSAMYVINEKLGIEPGHEVRTVGKSLERSLKAVLWLNIKRNFVVLNHIKCKKAI